MAVVSVLASLGLSAVCQRCGKSGRMPTDAFKAPSWCTCKARKGYVGGGPYNAPPGHVTVLSYETTEDAAFRERCRLASNAERTAKDAMIGRYVKWGRGSRRLPDSHPKVRALRASWAKAIRALEALQSECRHPDRSLFNKVACGTCHAHVECDVEHYRHVVREVGKRVANGLML